MQAIRRQCKSHQTYLLALTKLIIGRRVYVFTENIEEYVIKFKKATLVDIIHSSVDHKRDLWEIKLNKN